MANRNLLSLAVIVGGVTAAIGTGFGIYYLTRTRGRPEPLYSIGDRINVGNHELETVLGIEWRETTQWLDGGDGNIYPPQWWYFTGYGELPNWWPESIIVGIA